MYLPSLESKNVQNYLPFKVPRLNPKYFPFTKNNLLQNVNNTTNNKNNENVCDTKSEVIVPLERKTSKHLLSVKKSCFVDGYPFTAAKVMTLQKPGKNIKNIFETKRKLKSFIYPN